MKNYVNPQIEILSLHVCDVIATSGYEQQDEGIGVVLYDGSNL